MVDSSSQPTKSRRSFVWRIVRVALITYIALLVLMMLMENQLIYFPAKYPAGDWLPAGLPVEDAEMQAADGTRLHGWYIPHAEPRAVVLFLHGNAGNIAGRDRLPAIAARSAASACSRSTTAATAAAKVRRAKPV